MATASVYYKFKSQKDPSRITFDGTGISVWDLKREIILQNKMGKGMDFDIAVYNPDTEDEYKDDSTIIPRSSQVIARRLPPSKPGRGNAAQYVADFQAAGPNSTVVERGAAGAGPSDRRGGPRGQMSMRFDGRDGVAGNNGASEGQSSGATGAAIQSMSSGLEGDEASRIAAMFQASSEQWDQTQERMSHGTYVHRPGGAGRPPGRPPKPPGQEKPGGPGPAFPSPAHDRPPPIGYICFRCGTKGHWIHDCPTNDDREFDNKPRFKRTTGIPKSMLKTVEAPSDGIRREGVMVTPDGSYVVAQVDSASWARNQAYLQKRLTKSDVYSSAPSDSKLACSLCNKLLREAVRTPCCQTSFCQECITTHLLEHEFQCPECEKRVKDIGDLHRDDDARKRVREYVDAEMDKSEKKLQEAEQAEKEELDKVKKEQDQYFDRDGEAPKTNEEQAPAVDSADAKEGSAAKEGHDDATRQEGSAEGASGAGDKKAGEWNAQTVQQIMMMLCNPQLPPPMRMQLQMQLRFLHNQFAQTSMQQQSQSGPSPQQQQHQQQQQQRLAQQSNVIGAHNVANPFAGQNPMHLGGAFSGINGMVGNPMVGMRLANVGNGMSQGFRPAAPLSHQESAYMRLPVNPNKRSTNVKRERPTDFLELGGGGGGSKEARYA